MTIGVAVVAAVLEQVLGLIGEPGFDLVKLMQDVVRNGFIAGLLTFLTSRLTKQQEAHLLRHSQGGQVLAQHRLIELAVSGWSLLADREEKDGLVTESSLATLTNSASEWRNHANKIRRGIERPANEPVEWVIFSVLMQLEADIHSYAPQGGRGRRLIYVERLVDNLAALETSPDPDLAAAAQDVRYAATVLLGRVQHTNTTIIETLVVQRSIRLLASGLGDGTPCKLFDLLGDNELRDPAITFEPLYLLIAYSRMIVDDHVITSSGSGEVRKSIDGATAELLVRQLYEPLKALRYELDVAANYADALVALAGQAYRIRASGGLRTAPK